MKIQLFLLFTALTGLVVAAEPPPVPGKAVRPLFDGKTLDGWEGNPKLWRVEDGALTGGSLTETVTANDFLATTRDYENFIVRFKIKLTGTDGFLNSGYQIRSQRVPNNSEMAGYQCDYGDPGWYGCIYDESRRNTLMAQSDMKALDPVIKRNDWNDYVIRADGRRITTWINGVMGVDYLEADPAIVQTGKMGIQVHGGGKALVQVKDLTLEELPPSPRRAGAAEPAKPTQESPLTPPQEKAAFSIAEGLEMELVVEEDIENGHGKFVAVQFDAQGRLWTMTAVEYPVDANENPAAADALYASKAKDKVLVYDVIDRGTDGVSPRYATKPVVFADGLAIPLGILPHRDGCYVQHGHDLVWMRDTDGDGRADTREVILTGFGVQDSHLFPHQFTRAPGGWLWMAQGAFNYSNVLGPNQKEAIKFDQTRMAKFRPDGSDFTITSNGPCNIWGLAMNGEGETFIQEANDFGYPVMPFHDYANYPGCSNAQWKSYGPEFPATAPGFRMGGTGLSGLALTDARGSFPAAWSDVMLVANPITNRIQAIKMHRDATTGTGWKLEKLHDVVASGDPWFRPVAMTLGPDGAVYIVDWYNKIISHNEVPRNHPERDKKRGRIWRLKGKAEAGFPVPDFTRMSEEGLVAALGHDSVAQSHLAWQTLADRPTLAPTTLNALKNIVQAPVAKQDADATRPYPDARRIQALWVLVEKNLATDLLAPLATHPNPNVRREAATFAGAQAAAFLADSEFTVRTAAIAAVADSLAHDPSPGTLATLIAAAREPVTEPVAASTQSGQPIKVGAAYEREYERYLVRMFLENYPDAVAAFLDSPAAQKLPAESLMVASLALPAKVSAPRVARLLAQWHRTPNDEEWLRLAEAANDPAVQSALATLVQTPAGLETLLRLKTRFDAASLTAMLTTQANALLANSSDLAFRLISAFKLSALENTLLEATNSPDADRLVRVLNTLASLAPRESARFLNLWKSHPDAAVRNAALGALQASSHPDAAASLLALWPDLHAGQRRSSLDALTSTPAGSTALVAAIHAGTVSKEELDGPLVDKLQTVLKDDANWQALLASMASLFSDVLALNGDNEAFVASDLTLSGPFTVETWIKLDAGVGNEDSLLGAPGVLDLNFFDSRLRVWVGGLNDVCVARKTTAPDVWTHVAVTRDGDGRFKIYLNGELDQADGTPDPRAYEGLAIGRSNVATGTGAQLAEYRIWKTCRTPDEIRAVFDRTELPATPALAYYRPAAAAWDALHGPARVAKTMDFPPLVTPEAARSLDQKFAHFRTLAEKPGGDPARGKVAAAVCIACHKVGAEGGQIGPNLSAVGAMGTEAILRNILTPNAAMEPGYRVYRAELTDGSIKEGFLARQDADALIIRLPGVEDERLATDRVRRGTFTRRSLMPEGLEATFSPEQWTDLFAYLKTLR